MTKNLEDCFENVSTENEYYFQMKIGDVDANVSKAEKMIDVAVKKFEAKIVGLPEFYNT